ncbi:MAG: DUF1127 domain-containing protein [Bosea sp. (in: a-proteobacteria)]
MFSMTFAAKLLMSVAAGLTRIATRGFVGVANLVKAFAHRREMHLLSEMDERALKDIGLSRSDVDGALATSWLRDPTAALAARAGERSSVAAMRRDEAERQSHVEHRRADRAAAGAATVTLMGAGPSESELACCA